MKNINQIFSFGIADKKENILKKVDINYNQHGLGIYNIAKHLQKNFKITNENKDVIKNLLLYFSGNECCKYDLNKGLMIIGGVGCGKTLLFRIFKIYTSDILKINSFQSYTSSEIIDNINVNGVEYLEKFNTNNKTPITCYIDDIASKNETIKHFGTEVNVIEHLLGIRYNIFINHKKLTHCTSNLFPSQFRKKYDERIIDRMKEMFNIVELKGNSFRK